MNIKENFYVITGGPGVGKTTLLNELKSRGYNFVEEVARNIIKEQIETDGEALPWKDRQKYSDLMLKRSVEDFVRHSEIETLLFFDRGIPDTYAYQKLIGLPIGRDLNVAVEKFRYNPTVFILPPWSEIYHTDDERKQDFEEAVNTYEAMKSVYSSLGYNLVEVPKYTVDKRAEFILQNMK